MAKGKHISGAAVESRATVQIINRETDKSFLRANHQKLPDHDIGINLTTKDKVSQITVWFGKLQNKKKGYYTWTREVALENVKIIPGKPTTVVSLDKNQLGNATHCMMLCTVPGKGRGMDGRHSEKLLTPVTSIKSAGKL